MTDGAGRGAGYAGGPPHREGSTIRESAVTDRPPIVAPRSAPDATRLAVRIDDLAFFDGDAIARPVTAELGATTPLGRRHESAALEGERGARLARQLAPNEPLAVGAAVVTGAGALDAELLVHAVVQSRDERVSRDGVRRATTSALQRAADFRVAHLGVAPFGLGAGNLDPDGSAAAMAEPVLRHLARAPFPARVTIVVASDDERRAFQAALQAAFAAASEATAASASPARGGAGAT
ncbi:MAG: macro domain-containing protein [Gemmatimonadaceae bacterium]